MRLIDADRLETHEQLEPWGNGNYEYVEVVYKDDIDDAPTIEPERRWIPCSERLPDMGFSVLVSVENEYFPYVAEALLEMDGTWTQFRWSAKLKAEDVIAWMPLPKPYMGGER